MYKQKFIKILNMSTEKIISRESVNKQYFENYPEGDNSSINILNDDCLAYVFKFLPIADRLRSERGEYST